MIRSFAMCMLCTAVLALAPTAAFASTNTNDQAELRINGSYDLSPTSNVNGGTNYGIDTTILSAPIDTNWRLFAGEYYAHEIEPIGEGNIGYSRSTAGVAYQGMNFSGDLAPTYNYYKRSERVGAAGDATWNFNQNWSLGGGAQLFSRDIPLRALNAGITANSYTMNGGWDGAPRTVTAEEEVMTFSDDNLRSILSASDIEHLFKNGHFSVDGLVNAVSSQNSKDENRPYFNPAADVLGTGGIKITEPLYDKTELTWKHSLSLSPGVYWQKNYGTSPAVDVRYDQSITIAKDLDLGGGVDFIRQDADGAPENSLVFLANLTDRF